METNTSEQPSIGPWNRVTPLSKYLAMTLFILMPFVGGWIGYHYMPEKVVEVEKNARNESSQVDSDVVELGYAYKLKDNAVYFYDDQIGADVQTFQVEPSANEYWSLEEGYGIDKESIFWYGTKLTGIDLDAYEITFCPRKDHYLKSSDPSTEICGIVDQDQLFVRDTFSPGARGAIAEISITQRESIEFLGECGESYGGPHYWKDAKRVGCGGTILTSADPANFASINWPNTDADARSGIYLYKHGLQLEETLEEKTYTDTENGFSFRYPGDYVLTLKNDPAYRGTRTLIHRSQIGRATEVLLMDVSVIEGDGRPLDAYIMHDAGEGSEDSGQEVPFESFDQATTNAYAKRSLKINGIPAVVYRRNYYSMFGSVITAVFLLDNGKILKFDGEYAFSEIEKILLSVTKI